MLITKELIKKAIWMSDVTGIPLPEDRCNDVNKKELLSFLSCLAAVTSHLNSPPSAHENFKYIASNIIVLSAMAANDTISSDEFDRLHSFATMLPGAWQKLCVVLEATVLDLKEIDPIFSSQVFNEMLGEDILSIVY